MPILLVRFGDPSFKGGDVRPALEKHRGQPDGRRADPSSGIIGRPNAAWLADENGDRMLELRTLQGYIRVLDLRGLELGLCLGHIRSGCVASIVAVLRQCQRRHEAFTASSRICFWRSAGAQLEVIDRQFGLKAEARGL